ncbi:MAG: hypothetical protein ACJAVU_000867 [Cognaticolwellia sp.]
MLSLGLLQQVVARPYNKALKRENLQLAVFTPFNILANNKFPLSGALYAMEAPMQFEVWHYIVVAALIINIAVSIYITKVEGLNKFQKKAQIVIVWVIPFLAAIGLWLFNRSLEQEAKQHKEFGSGPQDSGPEAGE